MKTSIIYLLGAGRSGTTLLATVLNSHLEVTTLGEMHQFFEHLEQDKSCSCGEKLMNCEFWSEIVSMLDLDSKTIKASRVETEKKESHSKIIAYLFSRNKDLSYNKIQEEVFNSIKKNHRANWFLDSSKYIARFLLLNRDDKLNVKGIYVVRDVRGVINSFNKQVQTPKSPLSTILYYSIINFFGQITCWLNKDILKIRYEDFVSNPEEVSNSIYQFVFDSKEKVAVPKKFEMPHIIGGNRMKSNSSIRIKSDESWRQNISRRRQIVYYIVTFPLMLLNKYKI